MGNEETLGKPMLFQLSANSVKQKQTTHALQKWLNARVDMVEMKAIASSLFHIPSLKNPYILQCWIAARVTCSIDSFLAGVQNGCLSISSSMDFCQVDIIQWGEQFYIPFPQKKEGQVIRSL